VRKLLSQELVDAITALIDERGLRPGDVLPPEPRLMAELGASRNSIREALRTLQALGIVDIQQGRGTVVGSASMAALGPSLLFRTRSRDGLRGLRDLLEVRQILETELTRRVAVAPGLLLLTELEACVERMADPHQAAAADRRFHELICQAAENELALELTRLFWDVYRQSESLLGAPVSGTASLIARHRAILDVIRAGDQPAAAGAVEAHFAEVRARIDALA
jgi:DNA-binding FadR family transcriptional regulator